MQTLVYPGHAVAVALQIMNAFPNLDAANKRDDDEFPAALNHPEVTGAATEVFSALQLLTWARDYGVSPEQFIQRANETWTASRMKGDHADALEPGQQQADDLRDAFIAKYSQWFETVPA